MNNNFYLFIPNSLLNQILSYPILAFLSFMIMTCTILFSAKIIFSRKILVIIDESEKSVDTHCRSLIEEFCKKYFKVSDTNFKGQIDSSIDISRNRYNKTVLLSAMKNRWQGPQKAFCEDLQNEWKKDLLIFYISSEGHDWKLSDFQAAQENLCVKDYLDKKVNDKLEEFFKLTFIEEFRGTISTCILASLLFLLFAFVSLSSPIESSGQNNRIFEEINHLPLLKNATEIVSNSLTSEIIKNNTMLFENPTIQIEENDYSEKNDDTQIIKKSTKNRFSSLKKDLYLEVGNNKAVLTNQLENLKANEIVNSKP